MAFNTLGNNISFLRKERNLSGEQLGKVVGKGKAMISEYEKGKRPPSLDILLNLCDYFDVDLNSLVCKKLYQGEQASNQINTEEVEKLRKENQALKEEMNELRKEYIVVLKEVKGVYVITDKAKEEQVEK